MNHTVSGRLAMTLLAGALAMAAAAAQPQQPADSTVLVYDVQNGDQQGKLMLKDTQLAFESLSDARKSRTWKYADIREISKKRKEVTVRPFKGDRYAFQFPNNATRDRLFKLISERVVAARLGK